MAQPVIADGARFSDGSVTMFSEMDPPQSGDVLFFGDNDEETGPTPIEDIAVPELRDGIAPAPPTGLVLTSALQEIHDGELCPVSVDLSWVAPTTNADKTTLTDLAGYDIEYWIDAPIEVIIVVPGSPSVPDGTLNASVLGLLAGVKYYFRVYAVDLAGNRSAALEGDITTASITPPDDVSGLVLSSTAAGILRATWNAIERLSLQGFIIQVAKSTVLYPGAPPGPSDWDAWGTEIFHPGRSNVPSVWSYSVPNVHYYYKIRVKIVLFGNIRSANWVESSAVGVSGIIAEDFETGLLNAEIAELVGSGSVFLDGTGLVCKNGKFLFYSDDGTNPTPTAALRLGIQSGGPQVAAFNATGQKALLGKSGSFWGLFVEGGALQVTTAGDSIVIDYAGILGTYGGVEKFELNQSGLTLRQSDINIIGGGFIQLGGAEGTPDSNTVRMDTDGLRIYNSSAVKLVDISPDGIVLDSATEGFFIKQGGVKIASMDYRGFRVWDGSTEIARLGKLIDGDFGLECYGDSNKIIGAIIKTKLSGPRVELNGATASLTFPTDFTEDNVGYHYLNITKAVRASNVITITSNNWSAGMIVGRSVEISGCIGFNGTVTIASVNQGAKEFTASQAGADQTYDPAMGTVTVTVNYTSFEAESPRIYSEIDPWGNAWTSICSARIQTNEEGVQYYYGSTAGIILRPRRAVDDTNASLAEISFLSGGDAWATIGGYGSWGENENERNNLRFQVGYAMQVFPGRTLFGPDVLSGGAVEAGVFRGGIGGLQLRAENDSSMPVTFSFNTSWVSGHNQCPLIARFEYGGMIHTYGVWLSFIEEVPA